MSKEAIEALESARAHILDAYRIWQADDVSAVPPPKSGAGAVIAKIDAVLSSPIAVEGKVKALDEEQIAKLIWQHLPSRAAEEMTRDKHPPLFPQAGYTVATLSAKNFVEAIIDLASPSSPGKDGGQEVEATPLRAALRAYAQASREKPCPICGGRECDHTVKERLRADVAAPKTASNERVEAARDVLLERERQIEAEGWTPEHDDKHINGEMAAAAVCYLVHNLNSAGRFGVHRTYWPWDEAWFKPTTYRRDLAKAGALIIAEIERLDRAAAHSTKR